MSGRALLIGVSEYDSDAIPDLDFVANDLNTLNDALGGLGYEVTTLGGAGKRSPTHNSLIHEVTEFCRHGIQDEEVAILYFSGHGLHYHGKDYLVPADAQLGDELIEQMMVPVDFAAAYEQSRASAILFFIDACREGIDIGEKGALGYRQWGEGKLETIKNQQSAYVFACGPGEVSRFVPGPDGFSIFTRAFAEVLNERRSAMAMTFGRVRASVQKRMDELADEFQRKRQNLRVVAENGAGDGSLAAVRIAAGGFRKGGGESSLPTVDIEAIGKRTITTDDLRLLSYDSDGQTPWVEGTVPVTHVLRSAAALNLPLEEVLDRLRTFEPVGIKVPEINLDAAAGLKFSREDLILLPRTTGVEQRPGSSEVSAIHLIYAASELGKPLDETLDGLRRFEPLGLSLPQIEPSQVKGLMVDREDLKILSMDLDGLPPWLQGEVPITHVLRASAALEEPLGQVIDKFKRFRPCGIEVSFGLDDQARSMIVTESDLRLLSETLSGFSAWVDTSIPVGHAMFIANRDGQTLGEAIHQLRRFEVLGWDVPAVDITAARLGVSEEDLVLVSRDFDGMPPWLDREVPASRLLAASFKFQESVADVCERIELLRGAGFRGPEVDREAAAGLYASREDIFLVTGSQEELPSIWVEDAIPMAHILYAAHQLDQPVAKTAERALRMKAAGIEVPEIDPKAVGELHVTEDDLLLLSVDLDALRPWLSPTEVDWFHLLRASHVLKKPLGEIVEQLGKFKSLGYTPPNVEDGEVSDIELNEEDVIVLSRDLDSDDPWIGGEAVPVIHLLRAANRLDVTVRDVIDRLKPFEPLGIEVPVIEDSEVLDLRVRDEDLLILSQDLDATAPWIEGKVPIGHILYAAATQGEEVGRILEQLRRFEPVGFQMPEVDERGARLRVVEEDLVLLSRELDGRAPWVDREIPVIHLLRASNVLEEPIGETLQRLQKMELVEAITLTPFFADPSKSWRRSARTF